MRKAALAIFALALAACGQPADDAQQAEGRRDTSSAPAVASLAISPNGAAGITTALPMNAAAVRAAAPHFTVEEVADQVEGDPFTAITLSLDGAEVFRIYPSPERTYVHAISTRSTQARGPAADVIGEARFAAAPPDQVTFCINEYVDGAPGFACSTAADGRFWRIYKLPEEYTEAAASFEEIDPDVLHDAMLAEMRWIAPR